MKELNLKQAEIQTKLKSKKSIYNSFGKYHFSKAEDILEAIKPFLLQHSVSVTINEELIQDTNVPIIKSTAIITDGKDSVQATAIVGVDLGQKGMQTAQQFGAASSYGKKYALGNLFLIDDTQDSDATNNHGKSKAVSKIKQAAKPEITRNQLNKAVEYVKSGGDIEAIKAKYKITTDQENYLNEQTADNKETL